MVGRDINTAAEIASIQKVAVNLVSASYPSVKGEHKLEIKVAKPADAKDALSKILYTEERIPSINLS
jgi:hypothetical protein